MAYPITVAPTKLKDLRECIRIAAWDIVDPQPWEQSPQAELGDLVHDKLEIYNKAGVSPYDGDDAPETLASRCAMKALPFCPQPKHGHSEGAFKWTWSGVTFSGKDDWNGQVGDFIQPPPGVDPAMPAEVDYKTTGDTSKGLWELEQFYQDSQSLIYAKRRMELTGADKVYNRWLYMRTGEKKGKPLAAMASDAIMEKTRVDEAFERLVMPAARAYVAMKKIGKRLDVLSLPPNVSRCTKYGPNHRCPRWEQCKITDEQALALSTGENTEMSTVSNPLLAILEAEAAKSQPAPAAPPKTAPPVTFNPAAQQQPTQPPFNPFAQQAPIQTAVGAIVNPAPASPQVQAGVPGVFVSAAPSNVIEMPVAKTTTYGTPGVIPSGIEATKEGLKAAAEKAVPQDARLGAAGGEFTAQEAFGRQPTDAEIGRVVRFLLGR